MSPAEYCIRVPAQDAIGERIWIRAEGNFHVDYNATVELSRTLPALGSLKGLGLHHMPGEVVQYLLPSLYCPSDRFLPFVLDEFQGTEGGTRIEAIREWIANQFVYEPGSSTSATTALDSFLERRGICRDYAHILITMARASEIPARYVSVYAPHVKPQDFHAVAEVFLANPDGEGGTWQLVDATGMAAPDEIVKIGVGRDAADVSFLTSFGECRFADKEITVRQTAG
ncbi:MAG: transglutaminase family protein [Pseudomonadota bacterium]|nr:transglutaminase family protein [Pseudomonadota bacterium]